MREAEQTLTGQRSQVLSSVFALSDLDNERAHQELLDVLVQQSEARGQSLGQLNLQLLALLEKHQPASPSTQPARKN